MTVALDFSWRGRIKSWIEVNLEQGHSVDSIVEAMANEGLDKEAATTAVYGLLRGKIPGASPYEYDPSPVSPERVVRAHDREVPVLLRIEKPQLILFDDVFSADECDRVIEMAQDRLQPSATIDPATGQFEQADTRTSKSCTFGVSENPFVDRLDRRISALMNWPLERGEGLQVVHYKTGGQYMPHFDYFPPADPGCIPHLISGGQRTATLIVYLNDVEAGGSTFFSRAGISFSPRKGQALYFRYLNKRGQLDPATEHAGQPVLSGEKWIINKWMRRYGSSAWSSEGTPPANSDDRP
ncbi:2OG-Fe(II) oxygenase [Nocardia sp. NPDC050799]|uniref:2OG-Fe(II) oxygenase n=1 Tax=Nocardia sp. NPDC050799 TaxID=3154842 RepID=UPI0033D96BF6